MLYSDLNSERLNCEARLFAGCTLKEMLVVLAVNLAGLIGIGFVLSLLIWGSILPGCVMVLLTIVPALVFSVLKLGRLKQSKPLFYCSHSAQRKLYQILGLSHPFVLKMGYYQVRRELGSWD